MSTKSRKMTYDAQKQTLLSSDGRVLKRLECPLHKNWTELKLIGADEDRRLCLACGKKVLDLSERTEKEVEQLLHSNPKTCIYIAPEAKNVAIVGSGAVRSCPVRRIQTARTVEAINNGARSGFRPLVKRVQYSENVRQKVAVFQNTRTGEIRLAGDYRSRIEEKDWEEVLPFFFFYPEPPSLPFAAYLVPADIRSGERVYLEDIIEDVVEARWNQGDAYRLRHGFASWTGSDFKIERDAGTVRSFIG